jgi:hypothetical protein
MTFVRMVLQYIDTQDQLVLKEFQEWFDTLPDIQRISYSRTLRSFLFKLDFCKEYNFLYTKDLHAVFLCFETIIGKFFLLPIYKTLEFPALVFAQI